MKEQFENHFKTLDFSKTKDAWGNQIYAHSHIQAMWEGWNAALTQPKADGFDEFVEMLEREPQYKPRLAALLNETPKADVDLMAKDMEKLKAEIWHENCKKYRNAQGDIRATTICEVIDYLAAQGYIGVPEGWRDIAEIPDNLISGVDLLGSTEKRYINCTFDLRAQAWADEKYDFVKIPTHWMPLPAAPKKEGNDE